MKKQNSILNLLGIATIIGLLIKYKENIINFINPYDDDETKDYINIDRNDDENII